MIIQGVIGHIERSSTGEKNVAKYLVLSPDNELINKYKEVWGGIKNEIEAINGCKDFEYGKDFMKIKFESDDDLPLNKQLKFPAMAIIVRSVFEKVDKFYQQIYSDECLYEL